MPCFQMTGSFQLIYHDRIMQHKRSFHFYLKPNKIKRFPPNASIKENLHLLTVFAENMITYIISNRALLPRDWLHDFVRCLLSVPFIVQALFYLGYNL